MLAGEVIPPVPEELWNEKDRTVNTWSKEPCGTCHVEIDRMSEDPGKESSCLGRLREGRSECTLEGDGAILGRREQFVRNMEM